MISRRSQRSTRNAPRSPRKGLSLIEVIIAVMVLSVTMAFVGHISAGLTQFNRKSDLIAKRTFAMQQQANIISAMPFTSLTASLLPASKSFTIGDFTFVRRVTLSTTGTVTSGQTTMLTITIVPQTSIATDTLLQESLSMIRTSPNCGTVLGASAC